MKIKSLAFQTDLFFHRFSGVVLEYEDFLVVKTPGHPTYFWGNLIYFSSPPTNDSFLKWKMIFRDQFQSMNVDHMTFSWDSPEGIGGETSKFIEDGFDLEKSVVMTATEVIAPQKINNQIVIRPITTEREWALVIENHVQARALKFNEAPYRKFEKTKMANYKLMVQEHKGVWMGAFLGDQLVGDLGLFVEGALARFQVVGTHPDFRRQGICSTLIYHTYQEAIERMGAREFIIVADPDYHAMKIYESLGFRSSEMQMGMCKFDKKFWAT